MAPLKFEEKIKERLEERSIQPSISAWDKLEQQLDAKEQKSNNKRYWMLGIAASFVGVLLVSIWFFKSSVNSNTQPDIQMVDVNTANETPNQTTSEANKVEESIVMEESTQLEEMIDVESAVNKKSSEVQQRQQQVVQHVQETIVLQEEVLIPETDQAIAEVENKDAISAEDLKVQEIVREIQQMKQSNVAVTDSQIDSLLFSAQNELKKKKLFNEDTQTVDAMMLLQDVEEDLDDSFREKVFKALQSGYETVKTAVAQRND